MRKSKSDFEKICENLDMRIFLPFCQQFLLRIFSKNIAFWKLKLYNRFCFGLGRWHL